MRCIPVLVAIALLALVALSHATYPVSTGNDLRTCLSSSAPDFEECVIVVKSLTVTDGGIVEVVKHRRISSTWPGGSTINLSGVFSHPFIWVVTELPSTRSLSIDGISITGSPSIFIYARNTVLNMTNTHVHDMSIDGHFVSGRNLTGLWENNRFSNIVMSTYSLLSILDSNWTLVNQTFDNVVSYGSQGILELRTYDRGTSVTFGGNIAFVNIPSSHPMLHNCIKTYPSASPLEIYSMAGNPSNFVIQNSNLSLMQLCSSNQDATTTVEIGSIYANSNMISKDSAQRYLFQIDVRFCDSDASTSHVAKITVLQDVTSHGMGIVSRGYLRTEVPQTLSQNGFLQINGALTASLTGNQSSVFHLTYPFNVYAKSIKASLLPLSSNGFVVPSFLIAANNNERYMTPISTTFETEDDFTITSTNSPYSWDPLVSGNAPTSSAPTASLNASPSESSTIPYSLTAAINLNTIAATVSIKAGGSFEMSNFSLPRSSTFSMDYWGSAIAVNQSSLSISTTRGNIMFSNNQNVAGRGGAVYVASGSPGLSLNAGGTGNIVFNNNIAYYGGALYVEPHGKATFTTSGGRVELTDNQAISGGGGALLPRELVTELFPASSTLVHGNGAAGYGCVFAFDLSASTSDDTSTMCNPDYPIVNIGSNYRLVSSYTHATNCPQYESMCSNMPSPAPVAAPAVPVTAPDVPVAPLAAPHVPVAEVAPALEPISGTCRAHGYASLAYLAVVTVLLLNM